LIPGNFQNFHFQDEIHDNNNQVYFMNYPGIHPKYNFRDSEIAFSDNNFQMAIFVQNFKIICRANYGKIREFTTIIIFKILPQK